VNEWNKDLNMMRVWLGKLLTMARCLSLVLLLVDFDLGFKNAEHVKEETDVEFLWSHRLASAYFGRQFEAVQEFQVKLDSVAFSSRFLVPTAIRITLKLW
jgi:hypothetical protein